MEETQSVNPPLQADFLDVRQTLRTVASSRRMLSLACVFTAFVLALGVAAWQKYTVAPALLWLLPDALLLLLALLSAIGLWALYLRRKAPAKGAFALASLFPYACALLAGLSALVMLGVSLAALFSPCSVAALFAQLAAQLQPAYYKATACLLAMLCNAGAWLLVAVPVCLLLLLVLYALRSLLLGLSLKRLCAILSSGQPERARAGFICVASWVLGALVFCVGAAVLLRNPSAGICLLLYGASMFLCGLPLHEADRETYFLYTYYDKFNRSLKKQIDALRAAGVAAPLALPPSAPSAEAPSGEDAAKTSQDKLGDFASSDEDAVESDDRPASPPVVIHIPPSGPSGEAPSGEDVTKSPQSERGDFAPADASSAEELNKG